MDDSNLNSNDLGNLVSPNFFRGTIETLSRDERLSHECGCDTFRIVSISPKMKVMRGGRNQKIEIVRLCLNEHDNPGLNIPKGEVKVAFQTITRNNRFYAVNTKVIE